MIKFKFRLNKSIYICYAFLLLVSCKSLKVDSSSRLTKKNTAKEVLAIHEAKGFKYETFQSRVKANYDDGKKAVTPSITLRMKKNEKIWLSAKFLGFTVAKIYITPNRVSFYEKLNRRYYDGNFEALSKLLGQEVDFQKVQNIFFGQSILDMKVKELDTKWVAPDRMSIKPKKQDPRFDLELLFYMLSAKVSEYKVVKGDKSLSLNYTNYQKVMNQDFPEQINIIATQPNKTRNIKMTFKSVEINQKLSFPYHIPEGYTKFKLGN